MNEISGSRPDFPCTRQHGSSDGARMATFIQNAAGRLRRFRLQMREWPAPLRMRRTLVASLLFIAGWRAPVR